MLTAGIDQASGQDDNDLPSRILDDALDLEEEQRINITGSLIQNLPSKGVAEADGMDDGGNEASLDGLPLRNDIDEDGARASGHRGRRPQEEFMERTGERIFSSSRQLSLTIPTVFFPSRDTNISPRDRGRARSSP